MDYGIFFTTRCFRRDNMKNFMAFKVAFCLFFVLAASAAVFAQVDVARRTMAITYPLDDPVDVQFRGTTRFPRMKGDARVRRTGRSGTKVELSVSKMPRPFELGAGYATYVLWAIGPDGQVDNLGEIKRSGFFAFDSKITVTTPLQTFALIVTAEPHFLVQRPSQTIMLENLYPTSPTGKRIATTPAIQYFGNASDYFRDPRTPEIAEIDYSKTPSAILQAKQAVALAKFAGAERDAPAELAEAAVLLQNADNAWKAGRDSDTVDIAARKSISAAVKAENTAVARKEAREKRNEKTRADSETRNAETRFIDAQNEITDLKAELARETRNRELAERDALNFSNQIKDLRSENNRLSEEVGRLRVEAENAKTRLAAVENEKQSMQEQRDREQQQRDREAKAARIRAAEADMILSLKRFGTVVKTERGIELTLPETLWAGARSSTLAMQSDGKLTSLAEILANNSDYSIAIESHIDNGGTPAVLQSLTDNRVRIIADKFSSIGVADGRITAKGMGASLPMVPNTTVANRAKNRRIQLVLTLNAQ